MRFASLVTIRGFWIGGVIIVLFLAAILTAKADIKVDRREGYIGISISGTITEQDAKTFQDLSSELEYAELSVNLDSRGGDVAAAMQIGRLVRKYDGTIWIGAPEWVGSNKYDKCYSSCALIFIAGVYRINYGEIGLHRPFLAAAPQSRETVEKQVPLMLSLIKNYVTEMGITDNFYQQMVNTEPSQLVIYNSSDYRKLIPEYDPVYAEIKIARQARKYGVTTAEMRKREQDAEVRCGSLPDISRMEVCQEAIKWGLSEHIYLERKAKVHCEFSFEEAVKKIPFKLQQDDPVTIRLETCRRNIMFSR